MHRKLDLLMRVADGDALPALARLLLGLPSRLRLELLALSLLSHSFLRYAHVALLLRVHPPTT